MSSFARLRSSLSPARCLLAIGSALALACGAPPDGPSATPGVEPQENGSVRPDYLRKLCSSDAQCGGSVPYCCEAEAVCVSTLTSACWNVRPPPPPPAIALGISQGAEGDNGCLLTSSGTVECWPGDSFGSPTPYALTSISLETSAISVAAGVGFGCAVLKDDTVWCWGPYSPSGASATPAQVMITTTTPLLATSVSASAYHACVVTTAGGAMCWGDNAQGQLGNPGVPSGVLGDQSASPVPVVGLVGQVAQMAAGFTHTCALLVGGAIQCWGSDDYGELGIGVALNGPAVLTPELVTTPLSPFPPALSVSAGASTTCARTASAAYCWGFNAEGQVGVGTSSPTLSYGTPMRVHSPAGTITQVVAGSSWTNFEIVNGAAYGTGYNNDDAFGTNPNVNALPTPFLTSGDSFTSIAAGDRITCGLTPAGHVECVGLGSAAPVTIY